MKAPAVAPEMAVADQATPENLLMAAAEMHRMGRLQDAQPAQKLGGSPKPDVKLGKRPKRGVRGLLR